MDEIKELNEGEKEVVMDQKEKEAVSMTEEARTGKFSELEKRLDGMLDEHTERQQYVFRENRITKAVIYVLLAAGGIVSVVYFYFLLLCIGMLVYSDQFYAEAITGAAVMILMIVLNIYLVIRLVKQAKFNQRYEKYFNSLRFKNIESMEDLAVYAGVKKNQVIRDLKRAVKLRLIPQGHFGTEEAIFIVSDVSFEKYKEKQGVYDCYYNRQIEERRRMEERPEELEEILAKGKEYVAKIHTSNDIIKDKIISEKLDRMEKIVSMIFYEVDINPSKAYRLGRFMSYYLPTTENLLETYISVDEKQVQGETIEYTKKEIESILDKIIDSFENLLDQFYQEQATDVTTEIFAMETIMKQEGLIS